MTERIVLKFGVGAACLSAIVFAVCAAGIARTPVLLAAALLTFIAMLSIRMPSTAQPARVPRAWWVLTAAIGIPFAVVYLVNAAAPEISPDGSGYHLGLVRRYLNHGGFYRITTNMFASFTQGCEMLFLVAYAVGRHSAAALVHCTFLLALPAAMIAYARRFGLPIAGVTGALLVLVAPVAGIAGASAYVDIALAFSGFLMFYFLEIWAENRATQPLLFAGLLAGFCFAIKYTGVFAVFYALGFVLLRTRDWKAVAILLGPAACMAFPWLVKNWMFVDNPLSPFFNRLFPNPYVHISLEDEARVAMRHFNGAGIGWSTPLDLTVRGGLLQGATGPAFLLAPVACAAFREPRLLRILAAAALFSLPWFNNLGARFLLPALPFLALAMGMALARWPKVAMATLALNAMLCWPDVLTRYCDPYAWRITRFPLTAALRWTPERDFMDAYAPEIRYARLIQDRVPAGGVVYTAQPIMEAYTDRTILLNFTAALNNRIEDVLSAVVKPKLAPSTRLVFRFLPRDITGFRLIATAGATDWTIHEFDDPPPQRVSTRRFAWDAGKANDGQIATAWRAWQPVRPGDFIDGLLAQAARRESISLRTRPDSTPPLRLALRNPSGEWAEVNATQEVETEIPDPTGLRAQASAEARRAGITHLLIHDGEPLGPDFAAHTQEWNVQPAGSAPPVRLYEILPAKALTPRGNSETIRGKSVF